MAGRYYLVCGSGSHNFAEGEVELGFGIVNGQGITIQMESGRIHGGIPTTNVELISLHIVAFLCFHMQLFQPLLALQIHIHIGLHGHAVLGQEEGIGVLSGNAKAFVHAIEQFDGELPHGFIVIFHDDMHIALIIKGHDNGYGHFHARVGHIDRHQDAALPSAEQRRAKDGVKLASVVDGVAIGIVCDLAENVAQLVILGDQLAAVFKIFDFFTAVRKAKLK